MLFILGITASCKKSKDHKSIGFYTIECAECLADFNVNGETYSLIVFGKHSHTFINDQGIAGIMLAITPKYENQNIRFSFGHGDFNVLQQSHLLNEKAEFKLVDYVKK